MAQGQNDLTNLQPEPFTLSDADWTAFGENTVTYNEPSDYDAQFGATQEAPGVTMEAFMAEFLNNDTAWNPF